MQIVLPQKPKYIPVDGNTGKFEIDGCYPGYGTTIGNAIRRVLLSSLSGSAITSVKIKGIKHEFSTIPNVLEDVIQIILNLKQVRFKSYKDEPVTVVLKAKGEKAITAGMIECPSDVEVVTKDAHIATITNPKGEIEMEMEIMNGIGYVPVEQQIRENKEVGTIAIDAIYTPIRRVNYIVDNMRVGKRTDFEKITLEVMTDGSITPEEAFAKSIEILVAQFSVLTTLESGVEEEAEAEAVAEEKPEAVKESKAVKGDDPMTIEVSSLKSLSTRTLNVLEKNGIETISDIVKLTETEIEELDGMGAKGIKEIKKATGDFGINLRKE
ncbi:MAG: DNA-directed RNA polymerase subunit alpha [Candidatus Moranbacteria bacterium]|nr:DNA-directed RNA polymerase subunit alpha [Candidatus Moranbacteria bacterium]